MIRYLLERIEERLLRNVQRQVYRLQSESLATREAVRYLSTQPAFSPVNALNVDRLLKDVHAELEEESTII